MIRDFGSSASQQIASKHQAFIPLIAHDNSITLLLFIAAQVIYFSFQSNPCTESTLLVHTLECITHTGLTQTHKHPETCAHQGFQRLRATSPHRSLLLTSEDINHGSQHTIVEK